MKLKPACLSPVKQSILVAGVVLFSSSVCWGGDWQVKDGEIAHAAGIVSTDGAPASLEVRCRPEPEVTLTHPVLASMPANGKGRLDWDRGAFIYTGWGLDLTRPDHYGHLGLWEHCSHRPDCVRPGYADTTWFIEELRENWSVFIRLSPPDADVVDLRVSLVGSARAIKAICPSSGTDD